ncbi:MAG: hypothetical protein AAFR44_05415, partial [Pseudomonadota bacterium]
LIRRRMGEASGVAGGCSPAGRDAGTGGAAIAAPATAAAGAAASTSRRVGRNGFGFKVPLPVLPRRG